MILGFNVFLSAVVPTGVWALAPRALALGENILFGLGLFTAVLLVEVLAASRDLVVHGADEMTLLQEITRTDHGLHEVRRALGGLAERLGPANAIGHYFQAELERIGRDADTAVAQGEITISEGHLFLSDAILESLVGDKSDILRVVHRFSHNDQIVNAHECQWLAQVDERVRTGKIPHVRRLFVYASDTERGEPISKDLIRVHTTRRRHRYQGRLILATNFDRLLTDYSLVPHLTDFGIYGQRYVFMGLTYGVDDFVGRWNFDPPTIGRFITCFDACWRGSSALAAATGAVPLTMKEFLDGAAAGSYTAAPVASAADGA